MAGARHSKQDGQLIQTIHDNAIKLGAVSPAVVVTAHDSNKKALDLNARAEVIRHEISEMIPAFARGLGMEPPEYTYWAEAYVCYIYDAFAIVCVEGMRYYKVDFILDADNITIAPVENWQRVEMSWTPATDAALNPDDPVADEAAGEASDEAAEDMGEGKSADMLIVNGGAIKSLGDNKYGGYLVRFGDKDATDLTGDFFTAETDFDINGEKATAIYYDHGLDPVLKRRKIGAGTLKQDGVGVWLEFQLQRRDEYEEAIAEYAAQGKFGLSSGTAPHLVERVKEGKAHRITMWPLGLDASITPTPAEPRTSVMPLKSYRPAANPLSDIASSNDSIGEAKGAGDGHAQSAEQRARALMLEIDLIDLGA